MNVLFLCGAGRMRGPTAAGLAADLPGIRADFGGVSEDAVEPVTEDQLEWAEVIFVMEQRHRTRLKSMFGGVLRGKRIVNLSIPDRYDYRDPALIARLEPLLKSHLGA